MRALFWRARRLGGPPGWVRELVWRADLGGRGTRSGTPPDSNVYFERNTRIHIARGGVSSADSAPLPSLCVCATCAHLGCHLNPHRPLVNSSFPGTNTPHTAGTGRKTWNPRHTPATPSTHTRPPGHTLSARVYTPTPAHPTPTKAEPPPSFEGRGSGVSERRLRPLR
mgnify:CR=1 FL=1